MNTIKSAFLALDKNDLIKGLIVAVLATVFTYLAQAMQMPGFSFVGINWGQILQIGVVAGVSYLGKNLLTTQDGKFMGAL